MHGHSELGGLPARIASAARRGADIASHVRVPSVVVTARFFRRAELHLPESSQFEPCAHHVSCVVRKRPPVPHSMQACKRGTGSYCDTACRQSGATLLRVSVAGLGI